MSRELLFSVTLADLDVQHFRSGGPGGQNQNKRDTGARLIHAPSGARAESREERSQLQNTKTAFRRLVDHPLFRLWVHEEVRRLNGAESAAAAVDRMLADPQQIRVEVKDAAGRWTQVPYSDPLDAIATVSGAAVHVHG